MQQLVLRLGHYDSGGARSIPMVLLRPAVELGRLLADRTAELGSGPDVAVTHGTHRARAAAHRFVLQLQGGVNAGVYGARLLAQCCVPYVVTLLRPAPKAGHRSGYDADLLSQFYPGACPILILIKPALTSTAISADGPLICGAMTRSCATDWFPIR